MKMTTNIAGLMTLIKDKEEKLVKLNESIMLHATNRRIVELSGKENMMEDYQEDFNLEMEEYSKTLNDISYLKSVLYEKNNSNGNC